MSPDDASRPAMNGAAPAAPSIAAVLRGAARRLAPDSESPRLDAEVLLAHLLGVTRAALIAHADEPLPASRQPAYEALLARRARGTPVAYLTGTREFWSLPLAVSAAVLVPRPETEELVRHALQLLPRDGAATVLDLGTGSGAIALAIAAERPHARISAVDISQEALAIAAANGRALGFPHIRWRLGSWFAAVPGEQFDLIVSNPPYVAAGDPALARLAEEPRLALTPGPSGLEAIEAIAGAAAAHLRPGGRLLFEHGNSQAAQVAALLARAGFAHILTHADDAGHPRITIGALSPRT